MKEKTFPQLLMQNNTFQPNKEIKDFCVLFECSQRKKEKYQQVKTKKNLWPKHKSQRITLKITHQQLKKGLSHLFKNPTKENFEENF